MFIPIGGVFVFGNGVSSRICLVTALFNLLMGGLALTFGYIYGLMFLIVIGYIIVGFGLLRLALSLFDMLARARKRDSFTANEKTRI